MQLFVRCGVPLGTLSVDCLPTDTVADMKDRLGKSSRRLQDAGLLVLQHSGRILSDQTQLQSVADLKPWSTLNLSYRMLGGGGDGGSTGAESRSSYLEMYMEKKPDKVNPAEELLAKWTCCHLSNEPLCAPCVVDELGYVYNKEAVLHNLLNKTMPPQLSYISGLKHLTELKLEANSKKVSTSASSSKASNAASFQLSNGADFACPVTGLEYNGRSKFVVLRPSGIVVSEKALKELLPVVEEMAGGKWSEEDVLPINPTGDILDALKARVKARLDKEREKKAAKKAKKGETSASTLAVAGGEAVALSAGGKRTSSPADVNLGHVANGGVGKKQKVMEKMPEGANKEIYASLFLKKGEEVAETYCCRSLSARGMKMGA